MSPLKAIKKYCSWCVCGQRGEVEKCPVTKCPLYSRRLGKSQGAGAVKAIRERCLDCSTWYSGMVLACDRKDCPLYDFRMGTNPNRKGIKKGFGKADND